VIEHLRT
jgi:hypothetical protein